MSQKDSSMGPRHPQVQSSGGWRSPPVAVIPPPGPRGSSSNSSSIERGTGRMPTSIHSIGISQRGPLAPGLQASTSADSYPSGRPSKRQKVARDPFQAPSRPVLRIKKPNVSAPSPSTAVQTTKPVPGFAEATVDLHSADPAPATSETTAFVAGSSQSASSSSEEALTTDSVSASAATSLQSTQPAPAFLCIR
ncbi:hypothetical protein PENSPDRAFT_755698 [Peniophora sp. CONT]|nr:hypothetical protein PENSPDRAFT_755698 [Peniophora sp. CONT]